MFRNRILPLLLAAFVGLSLLSPQPGFSQDDLTLPGDEAPSASASAEPETASVDKSLWTRMWEGGKIWMGLIVIMFFALIALAVYTFLDLSPKNFHPPELVGRLTESMNAADLETTVATASSSPTCLGQVVNGAAEYIWERGYQVLDHDTIFDLMADASQEFNRKRVAMLNYFSVISQAAPMLGLLGTVSGMIKAFATLSSGGMGDPSKLAGNISEALFTTAGGLIIALPAIFFYFFFRDRLAALVSMTDQHANQMLNSLRRVVYDPNAGGYGEQEGAVDPNYGSAPPPPPPA